MCKDFFFFQGAYALGLINVDWMEIKRAARQNMKKVENRFSHMVGTDGTTTRSFVEKVKKNILMCFICTALSLSRLWISATETCMQPAVSSQVLLWQ